MRRFDSSPASLDGRSPLGDYSRQGSPRMSDLRGSPSTHRLTLDCYHSGGNADPWPRDDWYGAERNVDAWLQARRTLVRKGFTSGVVCRRYITSYTCIRRLTCELTYRLTDWLLRRPAGRSTGSGTCWCWPRLQSVGDSRKVYSFDHACACMHTRARAHTRYNCS